jgi:hypothetical protein
MMNKKMFALALLGAANVNAEGCAPEAPFATQNHFSVEVAGGASTMGGSPYSTTPAPAAPTATLIYGQIDGGNLDSTTRGTINAPGGYTANWKDMVASPNRLGFAGQLNMHYMAVEGAFAGGVYAGVGYNGAHSSSKINPRFDNTITLYDGTSEVAGEVAAGTSTNLTAGNTGMSNSANSAINANMAAAKATVSSGLMFQAGARLGAMIGNVFPHMRVGWATYQLKAQLTNQYAPGTSGTALANTDEAIVNGVIAPAEAVITLNQSGNANTGENFANLYTLPGSAMKVSSKGSKWTNALTLGGGVDWAHKQMTLGFYYQAAICQRVTFDTWNKDMTAGVTTITADTTTVNADADNAKVPVVMTYGKATPKVSISPVIHTVMLSAKYAFKA